MVFDEDGELEWVTETDGKKEVYHTDPGTSGWDRFKSGVIQALPVEDQL